MSGNIHKKEDARSPEQHVYVGYRNNREEFGPGGAAAERLAGKIKHDPVRLALCREIEQIVLTSVPYPYDVKFDLFCNQPPFFDSFIYTEYGRGMMLMTQSTEINHRMMAIAAQSGDGDPALLDKLRERLSDKYQLKSAEHVPATPAVVFLPGTNRFSVADLPAIAKLVDEDPDVMVKPHPLTHDNTFRLLRQVLGHDRLLDPRASGFYFLKHAERVYATTSSETFGQAVLLGKQVFDVSNYEYASGGTYSHLNLQLSEAIKRGGQDEALRVLANIYRSPLSGILEYEPNAGDERGMVADRVRQYVDQALELREHFRLMVRPARF